MDIRDLRVFLVVATELNFRRAAERLHMTQPPLTRLIAGLERDLRVKLFDRNTKRVGLTPAGELLARRAPGLIDALENLEAELRASSQVSSDVLRVGLCRTAFQSWVPESIERFGQRRPETKFEVKTDTSERLVKDVRIGRLDIACVEMSGPVEPDFESLCVAEDPVGVLMLKSHRLAKRRAVRLSDLNGETIIVHSRHDHAHVYELQRMALRDADIAYQSYTKKKDESCQVLVASGRGLALTGLSYCVPPLPNTVFVPLSDSALKSRLELIWREPCSQERLCDLVTELREAASQL